MSNNNQLTPIEHLKTENLLFSKPEVGNIPGQKISFKRIRIAIRNADDTIGDLILSTSEQLHSFGLQESKNMDSGKLNGYVLPICLWGRNGPSPYEKLFTDTFTEITEYCKKYLIENREEIEKYDLDFSDLKKFNPLFWKTEKGKIVEGRGPMLYCKVLMSKKTNKISTIFVDQDTDTEIDPFSIMNKPCQVTAAIKIESIFVGNKISLQVKLYEVVVKQIDNTMRGLLRPNAMKRSSELSDPTPTPSNPYQCLQYASDEEMCEEEDPVPFSTTQYGSDQGSIHDSLEDEIPMTHHPSPSTSIPQEVEIISTSDPTTLEKKKPIKTRRK